MPKEIDPVSPGDNLSKEIAGQIKRYSGGGSNKIYYENLFMRITLFIIILLLKKKAVQHFRYCLQEWIYIDSAL